ncbi:hypothetical protein ACFLXY_01470 [Chloroflexota bacterium]
MFDQNTITILFIFLLVSIIWGAIIAFLLKLAFLLLENIYSFLSKYKWFTTFTQYIIDHVNRYSSIIINWWREKIPTFIRLLEINYEIFGDIVVLGFFISVAAERFNDIQTFADKNPQYNLF